MGLVVACDGGLSGILTGLIKSTDHPSIWDLYEITRVGVLLHGLLLGTPYLGITLGLYGILVIGLLGCI